MEGGQAGWMMDGFSLAVGALVALGVWAGLRSMGAIKKQYQQAFEYTATTRLSDLFLFVDAKRLFRMNLAALFFGPLAAYAVTGSVVISGAVAAAVLVAPLYGYKMLRQRRLAQFDAQLPDALVMLSGGLRAGASLPIALESVVAEQYPPLSQEFNLFLREVRLGVNFDAALVNIAGRVPTDDFQLVVAAIRISREVGGDLGEILDALADTLRRKRAMEGKIHGLTAQGKLQGIVMTMLPVVLMLALFKLEPEAMAPLFRTQIGYMVLSLIIVMLGLGYFFIRKITTIDV